MKLDLKTRLSDIRVEGRSSASLSRLEHLNFLFCVVVEAVLVSSKRLFCISNEQCDAILCFAFACRVGNDCEVLFDGLNKSRCSSAVASSHWRSDSLAYQRRPAV